MDQREKIKIAQVVGNAKTGGVVSCVLNFYRNIDRDRFRFDFYTYGPSPYDDEIRRLGGEVFYIPNALKFLKSVRAMKKYFRAGDYYAVHAHLTTLSFVPLLDAKLAGVKYRICHAHSTSHRSEKVWLVKNALRHFSRLFPTHLAGCSRYSCVWLYGKKRGEKAFVLKNAIDLSRFSYDAQKGAELRAKYGIGDAPLIGNVGRFEFQKNQGFLIDAFAALATENPDARLALVGNGSESDAVEEKIAYYGLNDRIFVLPECRRVEDYFSMFDLFALPSRFEGLPLVAVEAQAEGIPCLLSSEITKETDVSGRCVFLPIDSPGAWADKMNEMLKNAKRYDAKKNITANGFEIKAESAVLEKYYLNLGEKQ